MRVEGLSADKTSHLSVMVEVSLALSCAQVYFWFELCCIPYAHFSHFLWF